MRGGYEIQPRSRCLLNAVARPRGILRVNVQMQSGVEGVDRPLYFRMVDLLPAVGVVVQVPEREQVRAGPAMRGRRGG